MDALLEWLDQSASEQRSGKRFASPPRGGQLVRLTGCQLAMSMSGGKVAATEGLQEANRGQEVQQMLVAGVFLSGGDVAVLAQCLERVGEVELANTFAHALDAGQPEMRVGPLDEDALLHAIDRCPPQLQPLKNALQANQHRSYGT